MTGGLLAGYVATTAIAEAGGWPEALAVAFGSCLALVILKEIGRATAETHLGADRVRYLIVALGASTLSASLVGLVQFVLRSQGHD